MTNTEKYNAIWTVSARKKEADRIAASITEAVAYARANGASWTEIGAALGISKQATAQRFGKIAPAPATPKVDANVWMETTRIDAPTTPAAAPEAAPVPALEDAPRVTVVHGLVRPASEDVKGTRNPETGHQAEIGDRVWEQLWMPKSGPDARPYGPPRMMVVRGIVDDYNGEGNTRYHLVPMEKKRWEHDYSLCEDDWAELQVIERAKV